MIIRISLFEFFIFIPANMIIDLITVILIVLAVWKGYSRGFILALFSCLAIFIGLAAAVKLSVLMSGWLHHNTNISAQWLPLISFGLVMIIVILLVRLVAKLLQASIELVMLGWLNRLAGVLLFIVIYLMVYSILLFYITQMGIIKDETINASVSYPFIEPFGPKAVDFLGSVIPVFKNMFEELQHFFGRVSSNVA